MKASVKLWAGFRMCRVVVFAVGTIMSMALSVLYATLLLREWNFYNDVQRTIISIILAIYGLSTILLYLMIIVRFRIWLDGARVSFLALFQGGATVSFVIFKSSLPCNNLSTVQTCETVSTVIIFGGWSLTGLLVFYAFCLAIMSHIPQPPPPTNPEDGLSDRQKGRDLSSSSIRSTSSTAALLNQHPGNSGKEKRHSFLSDSGSGYSQTSWIGSRPTTPSQRSNSLESRTRMEYYRPYTPQSIRPSAGEPRIGPKIPTSTPGAGGYTPQPSGRPTSPRSPPKARLPHLPNPFLNPQVEPMPRSGTPVSVASFRSDGFLYTTPYHTYPKGAAAGHSIPRSLIAGTRPLPPAYMNYSRGPPLEHLPERHTSRSPGSDLALERLHNPSTPFVIRPGVTTGDIRDSLTSPGAMTVLSQSASIRIPPNRRASLLSLPRSPSPHNNAAHVTSPAFLPSGHPRLHPMNLRGPQRFHELKGIRPPADLRTGVPAAHTGSPVPSRDAHNQTMQVRFVT